MQNTILEHPAEESLERFLLHQLSGEELEDLETHILACGPCIARLEELDAFIAHFKAVADDPDFAAVPLSGWPRLRAAVLGWLTPPRLTWVAAAAVLAAAIVIVPRVSAPGPGATATVTLSALRGSETPTLPAGRPLELRLNSEGLATGPVAVELVDSVGAPVWHGRSQIGAGSASIRVPALKPARVYFLRIFALGRTGGSGELLREFAMRTR